MSGTRDKDMGKQLKRLKQTINMKETLEKEKIQKLSGLNVDLKSNLKDQIRK